MPQKIKIGKLDGILDMPKQKNPPIIIMVHGFGGEGFEKEFEKIAEKLCLYGYAVLRFIFSGYKNGDFRRQCVSEQVSELKSIIDFVELKINNKRIGIIAQSLGSSTTILLNDQRIKSVVFLSPCIYIKNLFSEMLGRDGIKEIKKYGFTIITRKRTGQKRKIGSSFWNDAKKINKITAKQIKKFRAPLLILHGTADEAIEYKQALSLFKSANQPKKIKAFKGGKHVFIRNSRFRKETIKLVLEFFKKYL
jgi:uncharacterized protein